MKKIGILLEIVSFLLTIVAAALLAGAFGLGDLWVPGGVMVGFAAMTAALVAHDVAADRGEPSWLTAKVFALWRRSPWLAATLVAEVSVAMGVIAARLAPQNPQVVGAAVAVATCGWVLVVVNDGGEWALDGAKQRHCAEANSREGRRWYGDAHQSE